MASEPMRRAGSGFSRLSQSGDSSRFAAPEWEDTEAVKRD